MVAATLSMLAAALSFAGGDTLCAESGRSQAGSRKFDASTPDLSCESAILEDSVLSYNVATSMQQAGSPCTWFVGMLRIGALLFTPTIHACGDTIRVNDEPEFAGFIADAGLAPDGGPQRPPPGLECETTLPTDVCGSAQVVECLDAGAQLSTRIDPVDCDLTRGFVGDPSRVHATCEEAFAGQSGDGCAASFVCVRQHGPACCIEVVSCVDADEPLLHTRACAQFCPPDLVTGSDVIVTCGQLGARAAKQGADQLLGLQCRGAVLCDGDFNDLTEDATDWAPSLLVYSCVIDRIQILSTLPNYPVPLAPTEP